MITLRPYQQEIITDVRAGFLAGVRSQLIVSPTGSGKTVMFSHMAATASAKSKRVWILAHRQELLGQISGALGNFGVRHGMVSPAWPTNKTAPVQVASVFTIVRRLERWPAPDLIIVDEAHHAISDSTWGRVIREFPQAWLLGVTATPVRLSGEGLGDLFDAMVLGPTVRELIDQGALCDYRLFAPSTVSTAGVKSSGGDFVRGALAELIDKPTITGSAVEHYRRHANGKRAIVFCVSIEHARHVADQFAASGFRARSIDGTMERADRLALTQDFAAGRVQVLTSCDIISEGYDLPAIEAAILLRPTQSLGLYLQQVGRALRTYEGKSHAIILDHAGNSARHGLPDDDREWTLSGRDRQKAARDPDDVAIKACPVCFAVMRSHVMECKHCGHQFVTEGRQIEEVAGTLNEVDREVVRTEARREQGRARTLDELIKIGQLRGYKRPELWARHVYMARNRRAA